MNWTMDRNDYVRINDKRSYYAGKGNAAIFVTAHNTDMKRLDMIEEVLGTLITRIAQSSVGCLSIAEAETLLADLNKK